MQNPVMDLGDLVDLGWGRDKDNSAERHWTWPEKIRRGFMSITKLRPGFSLCLADFQLSDKIAVGSDQIHSSLFIKFCVASRRNYNFNMKKILKQ